MLKRFTSLKDMDKVGLKPRQSGQPLSEEGVVRDRKFAERAAAIEKLKRARLSKPESAEPKPKARKSKADAKSDV